MYEHFSNLSLKGMYYNVAHLSKLSFQLLVKSIEKFPEFGCDIGVNKSLFMGQLWHITLVMFQSVVVLQYGAMFCLVISA